MINDRDLPKYIYGWDDLLKPEQEEASQKLVIIRTEVWVYLGNMRGPTNLTGDITYILQIHKHSLMCINFLMSQISRIWDKYVSGVSMVLYIIRSSMSFE